MLIPSIFGHGAGSIPVISQFVVSSYGPNSNGTDDDLPAFIACVDACMAAGGGEVVVDVPLWFLGATGGLWNGHTAHVSNMVVRGHGDGSVITVNCPAAIPISFQNFTVLGFVDLVFLGGGGLATLDCDILSHCSGWQTIYERCTFVNVRAGRQVISAPSTTVIFRNCYFGGTGSFNGPGMIKAYAGSRMLFDQSHVVDYGEVHGVSYGGRSNPAMPWIRYEGNGSAPVGGHDGGGTDSLGLHVRDSFFDEGCTYQVEVVKEDPLGLPIRNVRIEGCGVNIGNLGGYSISGVDSLKFAGCDIALGTTLTGIRLRDVRFASIERVFVSTNHPCVVDADDTVTAAEILECNGLTKSDDWDAGHTVMRYNGVDV